MMDFYDDLAPLYHLLFADWDESMRRQGEQLQKIVEREWPGESFRTVRDVSCGIGTQALALAARGFAVTASDLSPASVERARREARLRGLAIDFGVGDMRSVGGARDTGFDLMVSGDNSVPHLLGDADLLAAFRAFFACLRPGGGCLVSVRDYAQEPHARNVVKPYGARIEDGRRYVPLQVWDFDGDHYDLRLFVVEEDLSTGAVTTHAMRSRYYAVSTARLVELMGEAGFEAVKRIDGMFYQPVLVGTRPRQRGD